MTKFSAEEFDVICVESINIILQSQLVKAADEDDLTAKILPIDLGESLSKSDDLGAARIVKLVHKMNSWVEAF